MRLAALVVIVVIVACAKPAPAHDDFWSFFAAHAEPLRAERLEVAMEQLQSALEPAHHGVLVELASDGGERRLVLTANGDVAAFPEVQALYATRPTVPHWTIVAFRQPDPTRPLRPISWGSAASFDPNPIRYVAERTGEKLDIALFVPNYQESDARSVYIALDHLIGEYAVEAKLGTISITALAKAPAIAKPIAELPGELP